MFILASDADAWAVEQPGEMFHLHVTVPTNYLFYGLSIIMDVKTLTNTEPMLPTHRDPVYCVCVFPNHVPYTVK